jgi:drug/metabolite transporter (DMT)-like permease
MSIFLRHADFFITHSILFLSQAPFGVFVVLARGSVEHIEPTVLVVLRFVGGTLTLLGYQYVATRRNMLRAFMELQPKLRRDLFISGVVAALSPLTFIYGLRYTTAVVASAIDASCPAAAILMALALRTETLGPSHAVCLVLSMIGNACVLELWQETHKVHRSTRSTPDPHSAHAHLRSLVGAGLVLASVCFSVANYNIQKPILRILSPIDVITYVVAIACALVVLFSLSDVGAYSVLIQPQTNITWAMIAYAVFLQGWSHNLLCAMAIRRSGPIMLAMYTTLVPAIGSGLAYLLLKEKVSMLQLVGIGFVVTSVLVSALSDKPTNDKEEKNTV